MRDKISFGEMQRFLLKFQDNFDSYTARREYITMKKQRFASAITVIAAAFILYQIPAFGADDLQEANRLFKQGQQTQALEKLNTFLSTHPKDAQARFLKGVILTEQNKTAEAIKVFTGLTEDYPELPEPYNNLAVLYAGEGQYQKAKNALEMAIQTHPSYATAHENLGDLYARMASQAYDRALQLDKSNASAKTKLSLIKNMFSMESKASKPIVSQEPKTAPAPAQKPATPAPAAVATAKPMAPPAAAPAPEKPAEKMAQTAPEKMVEKPTEKPIADENAAVLKTINGWAKAWSEQNVSAYLSHYAKDFKTPHGQSRAAWEKTRHERITAPKSIQVAIVSPKIKFGPDDKATVTFRQMYKSDTLHNTVTKTLVLIKSGDKWLIQQERVGS